MSEKKLEEINGNIEEIWHRLEGIEHFIRQIAEEGILGSEIEESIVSIARSLNKDFDKKYKYFENMNPEEV